MAFAADMPDHTDNTSDGIADANMRAVEQREFTRESEQSTRIRVTACEYMGPLFNTRCAPKCQPMVCTAIDWQLRSIPNKTGFEPG